MPERRSRTMPASKPAAVTVAAAPTPGIARLLPTFVTAMAAFFALRTLGDFDTWWHLAAGRWIVRHGTVPHTDTLSYTVPDHAWINLQWLYDVLLYGLYQLGGADLLVLTAAACFACAVWIAVRTASGFAGPLIASLLGIATVLVAEERFLIRPEMVSFILFGVVLRLLLTARSDQGRRLKYLPVLFLLWANLHALFIVGFVALGAFAAGALIARAGLLPSEWRTASDPGPKASRRLLVWGAASLAATIVNPFFHEGVLFPLELLSRIDGSRAVFQSIGEFRSPFSGYFTTWSIGVFQAFFFGAIAIGLVAAAAGLRRLRGQSPDGRGFDVGAALLFVCLAYLSTLARRNIGMFVFGATPIVATWIAVIGARTGVARALQSAPARAAVVGSSAVTALLCMALAGSVATNAYYRASGVTEEFGLGVFEGNFPIRASEFAKEVGFPPKLYNDLTAGGYLTWDSGVEGGVFIDGRLEVYDTEFFSNYMNALGDLRAWSRQADPLDVNTVVLFHRWANRHALIRALSRDPAWALVYYDEVAVMFVRRAAGEAAIARAVAAFPAWEERTRRRLDAPTRRWAYPLHRAVALDSYARLLMLLGYNDRALETWQRLLALRVMTPDKEVPVRYSIAWLLASRGEKASALMHAKAALALQPENAEVQQLVERLSR